MTKRKFPNLILNELQGRDFIFISPSVETERDLTSEYEKIYDYVNRRLVNELHRY